MFGKMRLIVTGLAILSVQTWLLAAHAGNKSSKNKSSKNLNLTTSTAVTSTVVSNISSGNLS